MVDVGNTTTLGRGVHVGAVVAGDLVADAAAWMVAGRVGVLVVAGMGDGGTGVEAAGRVAVGNWIGIAFGCAGL